MEKQRVREARESVRQARINLDRAETELDEALRERFWIEENEPKTERTVIRFSVRFGRNRYDYAGIKAGGFWYLTGQAANRKLTWAGVWNLINGADELIGGERGFVVFSAGDDGWSVPVAYGD